MYDFIRGPLVWISFIIFIAGIVIQTMRFLSYTKVKEKTAVKPGPGSRKRFFSDRNALPFLTRVKLSVVGTHPVMLTVTTLFHVLLFAIPLFLLAHNVLIDFSWGVSLFSFSEKTTDQMTMMILACLLFFLLRRLLVDQVKMITSFHDYLIFFLAAAPFLTGFMAYHGIFNYKFMISLHILSGELMLMAVPFTKFVHMVFFFVFRFQVENEYSLGQGNRTW